MQTSNQKTEDRLSFLEFTMARSSDAILWVGSNGAIVRVNEVARQLLGFSKKELESTTIYSLCPDQLTCQWPSEWLKIQEGQLRTFEIRLRTKRGPILSVEMSCNFIECDGKGYACVFVRDRRELNQAKAVIQELQQQNARILNSAGEGIFGLDCDGKHTFVNPAAAKMLGYEVEELLAQSSHSLWHHTKSDGSAYPAEECPIYAAYKDGQVHRGDKEVFWRKNGTSFPVEYTSTPIRGDSNQLLGAVVTFLDITERKEMAARLLEEAKVAEVTRVLGDIGHDIKNMLMPVLSGANLLKEELEDHFGSFSTDQGKGVEPSRRNSMELIDMIVNNARRIQDQVRDLADAVKGATTPPRFAPCKVDNVVEQVLETLRIYAGEKGVSLYAQGLEALPILEADERRLFNAFYNLVNNAIAEVPAGGSVTVEGKVNSEGKTIVVSVVDTGRGMPPEVRDSLFTPQAVSRKSGGTGLGTKIVKDVVDAHKGKITVESEEGVGTSFHMTLPIKRAS